MARLVENPYLKRTAVKAGLRFEFEVLDRVLAELPDSYAIRHSVLLNTQGDRSRNERWEKGRGREIDFVLAGPNGLFLLEAKAKDSVEGEFFGPWTFRRKLGGEVTSQSRDDDPHGAILRNKLQEAEGYVRRSRHSDFMRLRARGVFVFPDKTELRVFEDGRDRSTRQVFGNGVYQLTRISDLAKRIESLEPWCDGRRLSDEQAMRLVRLFKPGKYVHPAMSGDYHIVERLGTFAAANGLSYSLSQLRHALLEIPRLGKFYDVEPLAEPARKAFMVQVKRHAQVIGQMGRHPGIIGFHDMVTDDLRNGIMVIMEWVDFDSLARQLGSEPLASPEPKNLIRQLADALAFLHQHGFVRRDLHPRSILIERGTNRLVLTDFELAKQVNGPETVTTDEPLRENPYRALEVDSDPHGSDVRADVFSWAAIAHHMLTGRIASRTAPTEVPGDLPANVRQVISASLSPLCDRRPDGMRSILAALSEW
jgi:serine/threonine protein kinase